MEAEYKFRFTDDFLVEAVKRHRSSVWWRSPFVGAKWVLAVACAFLMWIAVTNDIEWLTILFGGLIGALVLGWPIDVLILRYRFRQSPFRGSEVSIVLDEKGIHTFQEQGETNLSWRAFTKARRLKDGFLLYQGPNVYNWLPDRAASSQAVIDSAGNIIRSNIGDFRGV